MPCTVHIFCLVLKTQKQNHHNEINETAVQLTDRTSYPTYHKL